MISRFLFPLLLLCAISSTFAQTRTVGTIINEEESTDGYTFFSPFSGRNAYMVDNCGGLVNQWERNTLPGLSAYFLPSGNVLRTYKVNPQGPFTSASNAGGLELLDWENNTVWSYELNTSTELSHHDAVQMANGNFLLLTWELIFEDELIALGRDPNEIAPQGFAWNERIIELKPNGDQAPEIVWQWRIKDHFVQNRDSTLANFNTISVHPELFDINLPDINSSNSHSDFDYNHFNAIDYHEELDQILVSVRNSDEIWILDHSTTTAEAASHTGGNAGMGGDILYRWGNPSAYQGASISKQRLFGQHGVNWIRQGPQKDNILIYNNGNGRPGTDFSTVEILAPPIQLDGTYTRVDMEPFGPEETSWSYGEGSGENFFSPFLSNAQCLNNGNILINVGSRGQIFEINSDKEIVWQYIIPLFGDFPATQGDNINNNATFRAYKFEKDFEGFDGIDIMVGSTIETDPNPFICEQTNAVATRVPLSDIHISSSSDFIQIENPFQQNLTAQLFDIHGRQVANFEMSQPSYSYPTAAFASGIYILKATNKNKRFISQQVAIIH